MTDIKSRKVNRLPCWDYSSNGSYFITVCTKDRKCILGKILVGDGVLDVPEMELNDKGKLCQNQLEEMNTIYDEIKAEKYIIMPNHIHIILKIENGKGTSRTPSPTNETVPQFISTFKRFTNKKAGFDIWQRSYYDHIIRNDEEYSEIWQYIDSNAAKWKEDSLFKEVKP